MQTPTPIPPLPVHSFLTISLESWLTIAAILIGPIVALTIQKWIEDRRARQNRKIQIFRELMASRASRLSAPYVQALNGIETEFYGQTKVIEAWRFLVDHLYTPQETNPEQWGQTQSDLLGDLLYEMGKSLGYHFDRVTLKRNVYFPKGWNLIEAEQAQLRQAAVAVFEGKKPLKVEVAEQATPEPTIGVRPGTYKK
jgi:uncharacterized protein DUF6680